MKQAKKQPQTDKPIDDLNLDFPHFEPWVEGAVKVESTLQRQRNVLKALETAESVLYNITLLPSVQEMMGKVQTLPKPGWWSPKPKKTRKVTLPAIKAALGRIRTLKGISKKQVRSMEKKEKANVAH